MEEVVDALGQSRGDLGHGRELADGGLAHGLGRAQRLEETRAKGRPDPGDLVEDGADGPPAAELLVIRDGEAMRLVADSLEGLERRRGQVEHEWLPENARETLARAPRPRRPRTG